MASVLPSLPFDIREYTTVSVKQSREMFQGQKRLHQKWGFLFTQDQAGVHWTLLGDHGWVLSLSKQARALSPEVAASREPSALAEGRGISPVDEGVKLAGPLLAEWPIDEFRAKWFVRGWPDEWQALGVIDVQATSMLKGGS